MSVVTGHIFSHHIERPSYSLVKWGGNCKSSVYVDDFLIVFSGSKNLADFPWSGWKARILSISAKIEAARIQSKAPKEFSRNVKGHMAQNCFQIYGLSQKRKTLEPHSWWFAPKMVQSNIVPEHLIVKRQTSYQTSYQFLAVSHKFPSTQQTRMS